MLILITGAAASGKSALAEKLCTRLGDRRLYLATMEPYGEEGRQRIARHRQAREGLGFDTLECYHSLERCELAAPYEVILLECLGNLVANELFSAGKQPQELPAAILQGIQHLEQYSDNLVLVGNDVFADGILYEYETEQYRQCLGEIQRELAKRADVVVESVCGLPVIMKGEWSL